MLFHLGSMLSSQAVGEDGWLISSRGNVLRGSTLGNEKRVFLGWQGQPARVDVVSWHRQCLGMARHLQLEYRTVELDAEVDCLVVDAKVFVVQKVEIFRNNVAKSCVHMFQVVHIFKAALQQFENLYEHQIREKIKLHIRYLELSGKGENDLSSRLHWLGRNILL